MRPRRAAAGLLVGAGLALAAVGAAAAQPDAGFEARVDAWMQRGWEQPATALRELQALEPAAAGGRERRLLMLARGMVLARSGREAEALASAQALRALAQRSGDPQAAAGAALVQALAADQAARPDEAAGLARKAYAVLGAACPPPADDEAPAAAPLPAPGPGREAAREAFAACDPMATWQALRLLQVHAARSGLWVEAALHARAARDLAAWAGDDPRLASSVADLARCVAHSQGFDAALPLLRQAQRIAARSEDPALLARVKLAEAHLAAQRGDAAAVARLALEALPLAQRSAAPRLQARVHAFLSDAYAKQGLPAQALDAAERGLPVVRRFRDRHAEIALVNNAGLGKIGLNRIAEGRADLARVEAMTAGAGLQALRAQALREYDEALAAAGDARGALEVFHRERELAAQIERRNRDATLQVLQRRYDHDRQQQAIALLERANQLHNAELANRELLRRVGLAVVAVLGLSAGAAALLYRRVRRMQRRLESSQAQLRVQSERDPLTQLANRRHFHGVMQTARALGPAGQGLQAALLLVDIDHFKHVNDGHGHAAGDAVLCEVARRLGAAVRAGDLVVRWGGEEFLVLAPQVSEADTEALAERVLRLVGEEPVRFEGREVAVTVSVGYASFPLPPGGLPLSWEQAINLADMALYTAKNQGRNRAVGIVAAQAAAAQDLRGIEADFDRAWHDGRVTLRIAPGPPVPAVADRLQAVA